MNILLSNDDGYMAEGINVLERVLLEHNHNVWVSAPSSEQSAKSHSMTISGSLEMTEYGEKRFHLSGTPADCIIYSHRSELFPVEPDLVIAGINHGYNLSSDILFSGTCAAARQATMYGMKAIAISCGKSNAESFANAARFLASNLSLFCGAIPALSFMNINVPDPFNGMYRLASVGNIVYPDQIEVISQDGNKRLVAIKDGAGNLEFHPSSSRFAPDYQVCREGFASVSLIKVLPEINEKAMLGLF